MAPKTKPAPTPAAAPTTTKKSSRSKKNTTPTPLPLDFHLYTPRNMNKIHMGTVYRMLMLISGLAGVVMTKPFYAWLSLLFFILSCLNQPLPYTWKYPMSNVLFPILLLALVYNINENTNPLKILMGF